MLCCMWWFPPIALRWALVASADRKVSNNFKLLSHFSTNAISSDTWLPKPAITYHKHQLLCEARIFGSDSVSGLVSFPASSLWHLWITWVSGVLLRSALCSGASTKHPLSRLSLRNLWLGFVDSQVKHAGLITELVLPLSDFLLCLNCIFLFAITQRILWRTGNLFKLEIVAKAENSFELKRAHHTSDTMHVKIQFK